MSEVFIGIGSNLGDRRQFLSLAIRGLRGTASTRIPSGGIASLYETIPIGVTGPQPTYLNSAVHLMTTLEPHDLLSVMLEIEASLGRVRRERNEPRTIDLDLLLYDARIIDDPILILPHPRIHERRFVLEPLSEIAPEVIHPRLGITIRSIRDGRRDRETALVKLVADPSWGAGL